MADRVVRTSPSPAGADLDAFRRHRGDTPAPSPSSLVSALANLPAGDDPAVVFARLAQACVPAFADGCSVEISDGDQPPFRAVFPADTADPPAVGRSSSAASRLTGPGEILHTPFLVPSRSGYPSYAGVLTLWWTSRTPTETDAIVADLMARHAIALVDRERLMAAVGRSDDRAAEVALEAISGRTINMAIGIVMHQRALRPEEAEEVLRQAGAATGRSLYEVATYVVRSGVLADPAPDTAPARKAARPRGPLRPVGRP
jgi:hypothetical protein